MSVIKARELSSDTYGGDKSLSPVLSFLYSNLTTSGRLNNMMLIITRSAAPMTGPFGQQAARIWTYSCDTGPPRLI
jgi:hypothetical protein